MATRDNIYKLCGHCGGDGIITTTSPIPPYEVVSIPCFKCNGKKGQLWGFIEKEVVDEPVA